MSKKPCLKEFEAIASRGGVLGAMETGYQRGKIQEESMYYEDKKHDASYQIIGKTRIDHAWWLEDACEAAVEYSFPDRVLLSSGGAGTAYL